MRNEYQYQTLLCDVSTTSDRNDLTDDIDGSATDGWRVHSVTSHGRLLVVLFERPYELE